MVRLLTMDMMVDFSLLHLQEEIHLLFSVQTTDPGRLHQQVLLGIWPKKIGGILN